MTETFPAGLTGTMDRAAEYGRDQGLRGEPPHRAAILGGIARKRAVAYINGYCIGWKEALVAAGGRPTRPLVRRRPLTPPEDEPSPPTAA